MPIYSLDPRACMAQNESTFAGREVDRKVKRGKGWFVPDTGAMCDCAIARIAENEIKMMS